MYKVLETFDAQHTAYSPCRIAFLVDLTKQTATAVAE